MATQPGSNTEPDLDPELGTNRGAVRAPRWVRVLSALAALFLALFALLHLLGGGVRHHGLPGVGSNRASPVAAEPLPVDGAARAAARPER